MKRLHLIGAIAAMSCLTTARDAAMAGSDRVHSKTTTDDGTAMTSISNGIGNTGGAGGHITGHDPYVNLTSIAHPLDELGRGADSADPDITVLLN